MKKLKIIIIRCSTSENESIRSQFHEIINRKFREVADSDGLRLGKCTVLRRTLEVPTTFHTTHTDRQTDTHRQIHIDRQTDTRRQTDRQTHRQTDRHTHDTHRQTDRHI